jgi:hypothetical protein
MSRKPSALSPWAPYVDRYRQGEWRDRIFRDMVLEDARRRGRGLTFCCACTCGSVSTGRTRGGTPGARRWPGCWARG